jgi:hypothetical protein
VDAIDAIRVGRIWLEGAHVFDGDDDDDDDDGVERVVVASIGCELARRVRKHKREDVDGTFVGIGAGRRAIDRGGSSGV